MVVLGDRDVERRALVLPLRDQLVERDRVDYRSRQDVRADFAAFFKNADAQVAPRPSRQLLQADRGRKPGGSGADDHHVIGHGFALAHPFSFVLSRPEHNSTRTPCQFLDRAVNAGRGKDSWAGK